MWEQGTKEMQIDSFTVRDFRKLTEGLEVNNLQPGITVIVGDNEEGKSTLLKALQSGFFDRHNLTGKGLQQMMPFGAQGVNPRVEVGFQLAGTSYRLSKVFGKNNSAAQLKGGHDRWEGEAAEDRLRDLLGFSRPGRGPASEEHRGLAGLLWVEQGRAFQPLGMNQDSQAILREAIEGEVGQVLGGERGRRLLDQVERRTGNYFTSTGRQREKLSGPRNRVEALAEECKALHNALRNYDNQVKQLGRLQESLARRERDGVLAKAKEEAEKSNAEVRRLEVVESRIETANAKMEAAKRAKDMAEEDRERRKKLVNDVKIAGQQVSQAEAVVSKLKPDYLDAKRRLAEAERGLNFCNRRRDEANATWDAARQALERVKLGAELEELNRRFQQAKSLSEQIERKREETMGNLMSEDHLRQLQELRSQQIRLDSALKAAAATLVFSPENGRSVSLNGQSVDVNQPIHITQSSHFYLHGFGTLEVTPGGQNLARLRTDFNKVTNQLDNKLRGLRMENLAGAERALRAKQALEADVRSLDGELRGVAPRGLSFLQRALKEQRVRLSALARPDDGNPPHLATAQSVEQTTRKNRDGAERAAELSMQEWNEAHKSHNRLREEYIKVSAEWRQKVETATGRQNALEEARRQAADHQLAEQVEQRVQLFENRRLEHETVLAERADLNPEALRMEQQRAGEAYGKLQERINADERAERDLAIELRTLGQRGLAEEMEQKRGELDIARGDLERVEADAKAWRLLLETLRDAEREAKETFLGPVRERLQPYLRMLFPETKLQLSEDNLEIVSLQRSGVEEPFDTLSIGAREQIAVLTRLALAELLREKGRPVVLILDDPLVNSDDERFRRMELALRKAADSSLQIVILTCHEARYETLGAHIIRLADCRM